MAEGFVPHHQLTVADFPIDDKAHPKNGFYIATAIQPRYRFIIKPRGGFAFAYIEQWLVFSGLNKKETSRKSAFKQMKDALPFAQALLDLNEINARRLAALQVGEAAERAREFLRGSADGTGPQAEGISRRQIPGEQRRDGSVFEGDEEWRGPKEDPRTGGGDRAAAQSHARDDGAIPAAGVLTSPIPHHPVPVEEGRRNFRLVLGA